MGYGLVHTVWIVFNFLTASWFLSPYALRKRPSQDVNLFQNAREAGTRRGKRYRAEKWDEEVKKNPALAGKGVFTERKNRQGEMVHFEMRYPFGAGAEKFLKQTQASLLNTCSGP